MPSTLHRIQSAQQEPQHTDGVAMIRSNSGLSPDPEGEEQSRTTDGFAESSELDSAEASVVDVALHLQDPGDKLLVARNHSHTPSRHVVALSRAN